MKITEMAKRLESLTGSHGLADIFRDWIESMAYALSNAVDLRPVVRAEREAAYMAIVKRHGAQASHVMKTFQTLMHEGLIPALEDEPIDALGELLMSLELGSDRAGQYFTPMHLCDLMAQLSGEPVLPAAGFWSMHEPAIGGGAMVIGMARSLMRAGFHPSKHLHVVGVDIDRKVLMMAYVQLSLLGIPAVLYVGDTLRMEMREVWYTPVHVFDGWGERLAIRGAVAKALTMLEELHDGAHALGDSARGDDDDEDSEGIHDVGAAAGGRFQPVPGAHGHDANVPDERSEQGALRQMVTTREGGGGVAAGGTRRCEDGRRAHHSDGLTLAPVEPKDDPSPSRPPEQTTLF